MQEYSRDEGRSAKGNKTITVRKKGTIDCKNIHTHTNTPSVTGNQSKAVDFQCSNV